MNKTLTQRVGDSFSDSDHEDLSKYSDWLLDSFKNDSQNIRRMIILTLFLIAIFEIIAQSTKIQVNLLQSFQLSRSSIVFTFIPALIAYLYLQIILDTVRIDRMGYIFQAAFRQWSSSASDNDLDIWIVPTLPVYWNVGTTPSGKFRSAHDTIEGFLNHFLWGTVLLGVLGFEAQAFYVLFNSNLSKDIAWFISVSISFFFIFFAISYNFAYMVAVET